MPFKPFKHSGPRWPFARMLSLAQRPALKETAWLDGLRGVAAFLVVMNHYSMAWLSIHSDAPFGSTALKDDRADGVFWVLAGDRYWGLWRLPILRLLMTSGNAQVAIFFVLSGFVLSWRPLELLRANRLDELLRSLSSSVVRRWFRLYLPCFGVMFMYQFQDLLVRSPGGRVALTEMWVLLWDAQKWASPFKTEYKVEFAASPPSANFAMWTIPFEYSGSVFIFGFVLALSRVRDYRRRMSVIILISLYALFSAYWNYWLFGSGLALADYVRQAGGCTNLSQRANRRVWTAVLAVGLVMLGYTNPSDYYTTPGYDWTERVPLLGEYVVNRGRVWWGVSATLIIASCCHLTEARRALELAVIQYLGKISFMLYLTHLMVNTVVSLPLRQGIYDHLYARGSHGPFNDVYAVSSVENLLIYCFVLLISVLMATALAHLMEIWVDRPCTAFGKWVDMRMVNGFGASEYVPAPHEDAGLLQHQALAKRDEGTV